MTCLQVRARMDLLLDRQLPEADAAALEQHLETCDECRFVLSNRRALRARFRNAIRNEDASPDLAYRVQSALAQARPPRRFPVIPFSRPILAIAASVLIAAAVYRFRPGGEAPPTRETQAEFIARATAPLAPLMKVGFRQHLHCGVFREYPAVAPALADLAREKSVSPALIDAVETHAPSGLHVVMAHRCSYQGRNYIHVVARGEGHLMSLLITKRLDGEAFGPELRVPATALDLPMFATGAQDGREDYSIDAFEASGYVVFLVSDSAPTENRKALESMAAQVRAALL